ncbi:hypothetical protein ACTZWW_11905 [Salinarimonas sp. NSM]|uniref:hypothetical protein n=1 Tax=Salinarimonas sp. NSM TaxID=3458003 RepID=UPI00403699B5
MSNQESIILPMLREIRGLLHAHGEMLQELRARVSHLEHQGATSFAKMDRVEDRLDRIERRLEIVEPGFSEGDQPTPR